VTVGDGIVLVSMPFGDIFSPSIGLSLLKAELAAQGMSARVRYFSIAFAERIGQGFYYGISSTNTPSIQDLAGDWIFSSCLFGSGAREEEYVDLILRKRGLDVHDEPEIPASSALVARILRARREAEGFLEWCRQQVVRDRPRLVGFTSMFQQHVASLALAP
jgi:hypothetical protein